MSVLHKGPTWMKGRGGVKVGVLFPGALWGVGELGRTPQPGTPQPQPCDKEKLLLQGQQKPAVRLC